MSTKNTLLGIISGVAVGAIAGILFAPHKGEKTRAKISAKSKELKIDLDENMDQLSEKATEKYEELKKVGKEYVAKAKDEYTKAKEEIKVKAENLVEKTKEEIEKGKKKIA